jgi:hypothetical protein
VAKHTWTYDHRIKWDEATILAIDSHTAICIQAQTANIFARFFTFETGRLPLETEMYSPLM